MLNKIMRRIFAAAFLCLATLSATRAADYPPPTEGDYTIHNFKFASGETLPELRIHYRTLGKIDKDAQGKTRNAVLITHGTTGSGATDWLKWDKKCRALARHFAPKYVQLTVTVWLRLK